MNPKTLSSFRTIVYFVFFIMVFAIGSSAQAQGMMGAGSCSMCGAMGWVSIALGTILTVALIALIVTATIFLVRRMQLPQR